MQNELKASSAGTVATVHVQEGATVLTRVAPSRRLNSDAREPPAARSTMIVLTIDKIPCKSKEFKALSEELVFLFSCFRLIFREMRAYGCN